MTDIVTLIQNDIVTVTNLPNKDIVTIADNSLRGPQGIQGPQGDAPEVSVYNSVNAILIDNVLSIDASEATTFLVNLDQNIDNIEIIDWPPEGKTQRVVIYFQQAADGGFVVSQDAWPEGTIWNEGAKPSFLTDVGTVGCIVLDTFDGGQRIFGNIVGYNYF